MRQTWGVCFLLPQLGPAPERVTPGGKRGSQEPEVSSQWGWKWVMKEKGDLMKLMKEESQGDSIMTFMPEMPKVPGSTPSSTVRQS